MRNTPSENPKNYKTKVEKETHLNADKVSSVINLVDEIDTTMYIINHKLIEDSTILGWVRTARKGPIQNLSDLTIRELKVELQKK